ncbi:type I restriction-modification system subunit M [Fulvivirga sediminis]|uniref:site-specific DNA-methyltransferase (adenine-specific) n=1 Tax=Fulvivirga sediminis TaxID=2803949 RepID=A0A937F693_9BACT|nr:class I SAM-dependent DNA methyltransferase [Fulvivirga sediminis]MBL3657156.1 SAM-dependent DNA methyltransferase [Fulvivirga sediminis]
MITGELKSQVDKIWEAFWTGGTSNPLTVIEQFTYLLFLRRVDERQQLEEKKANLIGESVQNPFYTAEEQELRWSSFINKEPETMFDLFTKPLVNNKTVFDHMKELGSQAGVFAQYMKGATFMISTPKLLDQVVQMIAKIKMDDRDTKGDLYEYLLSKIASAGTNGQFRTPRHIIQMMVEMTEPTGEDLICDPSCGSAGFLVASGEYFHQHHADYFHDKTFRDHYNSTMFTGIEFDSTMLRIGAMNLQLHGIENPELIGKDALSESNDIKDRFTLILANPPFKGSLDYDGVEKSLLQTVKTKKTELLFLGLMLRMLKTGGRAAVIIPDGVLFGSSKAHKEIRKEIIDGHKLEAVISMPSGVFKPYAGVSTAVIFFTKTNSGGTENVWFYDMQADGFSLDDKRTPLKTRQSEKAAAEGTKEAKKETDETHVEIERDITTQYSDIIHENNNIPDIIARWKSLNPQNGKTSDEYNRNRTEQSFMVPAEEIRSNDYDLSINRYKEIVYEEVQYAPPAEIIAEIESLNKQRSEALETLKKLLS